MQNETQPNSTGPKVADHERQSPTALALNGAQDAPTAESSPCKSSDQAKSLALGANKPKWLTEAITEARQLINQGLMVDETVVRALLRGIAEAYGEHYEPVHRCSLDKPAVFDHDKFFPHHRPGQSHADHGFLPNTEVTNDA